MVERYGMDWYGEVSGDGAIVPRPDGEFVRYSDYEALRARLETVGAETRERLSNELDPEIGLPSDARLRSIHADLEMRGRKHPDFAVTVHHRNIVLSAVAAELRNLEPRHD